MTKKGRGIMVDFILFAGVAAVFHGLGGFDSGLAWIFLGAFLILVAMATVWTNRSTDQ